MKEHKYPQVAVIIADGPEQLQEKINSVLKQHPDVTNMVMPEGNSFRAIIQYAVTETIPEDEGERFYIETGKRYCCNDCPFLELDPDRRSATHWCAFHEDRVKLKDVCCNDFFTGLSDGRFHLVTPEERNKQFDQMDRDELQRRKELRSEMQQASKHKREILRIEKELLKVLREKTELKGK